MQAAKDLALTENELNIVDCAWKATGVVQGTCSTIVDPKATPVPTAPAPGTTADPGSTTGTTPGGTTDTTPDDPTTSTGTTPTAKKKRTTLTAQDSSGCNASASTPDLGPLAGLLAAVFGLAVSRRRKRP
jgi:MYXO-CTERM domain-containing protein